MNTNIQAVIVNFGDDATTWFRDVSAAVEARPQVINVQFVGGACPPAFETISLRNVLLQIPQNIKLVTTASCSLPPFTCAAWLVGDERHIAKDAVVWIPKLPRNLMSSLPRIYKQTAGGDSGNEFGDAEDQDEEGASPDEECLQPPQERLSRREFIMAGPRIERDLRVLADAVNEWFPAWEFAGSSLGVDDLIEWNVIQPEWAFGGRSPRTRYLSEPTSAPCADTSSEKPASKPAAIGEPQTGAGSIPL